MSSLHPLLFKALQERQLQTRVFVLACSAQSEHVRPGVREKEGTAKEAAEDRAKARVSQSEGVAPLAGVSKDLS